MLPHANEDHMFAATKTSCEMWSLSSFTVLCFLQLEKDSGMDHSHSQTRPADILIPSWSMGKPAACDITVVHPLNPNSILGASTTCGFCCSSYLEEVKMAKNGPKCHELGWECIPLAVETYGGWGEKTHQTFEHTCRRLAVGSVSNEIRVRQELSGRLSLTLKWMVLGVPMDGL